MTKTHFKLFFLTLLLLSLQPLSAQENLVLPYKAADKTYFFFAVQKGQFMIPLRNNSFLDVPHIYIYAMNPYVNTSKRIEIRIEILNATMVNGTLRLYSLESKEKSIIITDDFSQNRIDLPVYSQDNVFLRISYLNLKIVFTYKVNPLYLRSQNELMLQRIIGYTTLVIILIVAVIFAMYLSRRILDKIVYFPGDPTIMLITATIVGFMAYSYISNLQYLDPATYVSISAFLVNNYNILLITVAVIVTMIAGLYIFRKKPDQILLMKFRWTQPKGPESREMNVETYLVDILPGNITAPSKLSYFLFYLFGIRQKLVFEDEWYIKDDKNIFKKIYLVDSKFNMSDLELKIEINWKHLLVFLVAIVLIISRTPIGVLAGLILISLEAYISRDRTKKKKQGDDILVEKIPGVKLIKIKNKEVKVKLAPMHYKRLFEHFYDLLNKKALLDEAYEARKQVTILLSEKEVEKLEALRDYTDVFLEKFRKLLEGGEENEGRERA